MKIASIRAVDAFVIMQTLMRHLKCHVHYSEEAAVQTTVIIGCMCSDSFTSIDVLLTHSVEEKTQARTLLKK